MKLLLEIKVQVAQSQVMLQRIWNQHLHSGCQCCFLQSLHRKSYLNGSGLPRLKAQHQDFLHLYRRKSVCGGFFFLISDFLVDWLFFFNHLELMGGV